MLFPGQGSQYVGMLRELACLFPEMHDALAEAERGGADDDPRLQRPDLSAPGVLRRRTGRGDEAALRATEVAQPAIGAVSLGLLGILEHFGVRPDAVGRAQLRRADRPAARRAGSTTAALGEAGPAPRGG